MNVKNGDIQDKIAQLFTVSALSSKLDAHTQRLISEWKIGGLFLGTNCLIDPQQVYSLTSAAQQLSINKGSGTPLFISADFVAGAGCKFKGGATHFPKNRAIGATSDRILAYETGRITANESLSMGVNFNYSPVVDINNNPLNPVIGTHSFGDEYEKVVQLSTAVIRGYQDHGMIATAKHFPGHGDTSIDSHDDLPVLPFTTNRLHEFELIPFKEAIEEGVDAVMVGHIAVPAIDPSLKPTSLSYELTTNLLRKELGFEGLIVTDGLSMKGITNKFSMEEACVMAIQAGSDILLATTDSYDQVVSMIEAVVSAVEKGDILESRIDESIERIQKVKQKYGLTTDSYIQKKFDPLAFLTSSSKNVNDELARKAVTPIGNISAGIVASWSGEINGITLISDQKCKVFSERIIAESNNTHTHLTSSIEETIDLLKNLDKEKRVILATAESKPLVANRLATLLKHLLEFNHVIWVHFGSEYDVVNTSIPCVLMYDYSTSLQNAAANYLLDIENKEV